MIGKWLFFLGGGELFSSKCGKISEIWTKIVWFSSKCGKKSEIWMKIVWWYGFLVLYLQ